MPPLDSKAPAFTVSDIAGESGVFAARDLAAGEVIGSFEGNESATRTQMSLQFGTQRHIEPGDHHPLRFLNHACEPTAIFSETTLVARTRIPAGTEITIDYTCHEPVLAFPFTCRCGATGCLGTVRGWNRLDAVQRQTRRDRAGIWLLPDPASETARQMFCKR